MNEHPRSLAYLINYADYNIMKILTRDALEKARRFIEKNGRQLEIARFYFEFDEGPIADVLESLNAFQNQDGGFGCALEPDLRAQESSALCTSIALQTLRSLGVPAENLLVSNTIEFLLAELNEEQLSWRIIPASADQSPRAPWWYQKGRKEQFESFSLNPTAEILGYLYDYPSNVPDEIVECISNRVLSEIICLEKIEMHDLLCCLRLLQTKNLPEVFRNKLYLKINNLVKSTICCDPEGWETYCLRPLQVVDTPQSPFVSGLEEAIDLNLGYEIQSQEANGSWRPTWSWDDQYPKEWEEAKREWTGILTLEKLLLLKRFNRIEKGT